MEEALPCRRLRMRSHATASECAGVRSCFDGSRTRGRRRSRCGRSGVRAISSSSSTRRRERCLARPRSRRPRSRPPQPPPLQPPCPAAARAAAARAACMLVLSLRPLAWAADALPDAAGEDDEDLRQLRDPPQHLAQGERRLRPLLGVAVRRLLRGEVRALRARHPLRHQRECAAPCGTQQPQPLPTPLPPLHRPRAHLGLCRVRRPSCAEYPLRAPPQTR